MPAVAPCLIRGGCHDPAPVGRPTHDDRLTAVVRVIPLLDAGIECVQVDMQDRSCCFVFVHALCSFPAVSPTWCFHCISFSGHRPRSRLHADTVLDSLHYPTPTPRPP